MFTENQFRHIHVTERLFALSYIEGNPSLDVYNVNTTNRYRGWGHFDRPP